MEKSQLKKKYAAYCNKGQLMVNGIFNAIKHHIPHNICLKSRKESGILVVLSADGNIEFFNQVASEIVDLIDGVRSIENIYSIMKMTYDVNAELLMNDIINLIRTLQWKRIIFMQQPLQSSSVTK